MKAAPDTESARYVCRLAGSSGVKTVWSDTVGGSSLEASTQSESLLMNGDRTPGYISSMTRTRISTTLIGAAGESFVLFQLYRRGLLAGQPPAGVADVDLLVLDESAQVITNLQVKTRTYGSDGGWHMKVKHESLVSNRLFYVFVDLEPDVPTCFVIPSRVVAEHVKMSHATWLSLPGRNGRPHQESQVRRLIPNLSFAVEGFPPGWIEKYREDWSSLISSDPSSSDQRAV